MTAQLGVELDRVRWLRASLPEFGDVRAAVLFLTAWMTAIAVAKAVGWYPAALLNYVLVGVLGAVAVLLCRRMPLVGLSLVSLVSASPSWYFGQPEISILPIVIAGFIASASGLRILIAAPIALVCGALTLSPVFYPLTGTRPEEWVATVTSYLTYNDPSSRALALVVVAAALLLGRSIRQQRVAVLDLARKNEELLRLRDADMARAASDERAAVARDIHDVVAHHVAAMVIRAQAAERVADTRPSELRSAVSWIAASGQEALASMRQVVRVLSNTARDDGETFGAAIRRIADRVEQTGVSVSTDVRLDATVSAEQEAAIVRIVQESLTNVMLHSDAKNVALTITADDGSVDLSISDDGHAVEALEGSSGGNGLRGMRDRVRELGGTIDIGPGEGGGWTVRAWMPTLIAVVA